MLIAREPWMAGVILPANSNDDLNHARVPPSPAPWPRGSTRRVRVEVLSMSLVDRITFVSQIKAGSRMSRGGAIRHISMREA